MCAQIRETRQAMRDSESGVERLAIGHHIRDRGHVMERSRNRRTGDHEERQDYINLEESEYTEIRRFCTEKSRALVIYSKCGSSGWDHQVERYSVFYPK